MFVQHKWMKHIYILSSVPCAWFYLHLDDLVVRCCLKKPPYMEDTVSPWGTSFEDKSPYKLHFKFYATKCNTSFWDTPCIEIKNIYSDTVQKIYIYGSYIQVYVYIHIYIWRYIVQYYISMKLNIQINQKPCIYVLNYIFINKNIYIYK